VNTYVQSAVHLDHHPSIALEDLTFCKLPTGFLFLVDEATGRIVEPVLLYLTERYLVRQGNVRPNTLRAAVYHLKDWWAYLAEFAKTWNEIDTEDVRFYRDAMLQTVSPKTHQPYDVGTVRRRLGTVLQFYEWARREGFYQEILNPTSVRQIARSRDLDAMAHLHASPIQRSGSDLLPLPRRGADDAVRPLTETEYRSLAHCLGPLPPGNDETVNDQRSCMDRLIAELSLHTGMRRDEITSLRLWQVLDLRPEPSRPFAVLKMRLTQTKGLRPRTVFLPNWLALALQWYVEHERKAVLRLAKSQKPGALQKEPSALFLNGVNAGRHAGKPLQNGTVDGHFRQAVFAAGLTYTVHKTDPVSGEHYSGQAPNHVFHDLRHTFAVWMYQFEKAQGNAEPWKKIQSRLGHQALSTTTGLYLRAAGDFEARVSDAMMKFFEGMRHE
jgi:integrase/recombinase XerC